MPHTIALPADLSTRESQTALYKALVAELTDLQNTLQAALRAAKGPQAKRLQELTDKDKPALRQQLTTALTALNNHEDASLALSLAVTAHNLIVDGLAAPAEVVIAPSTSVTGTHVLPAVTDTPAPRPRPVVAVATTPPTPPTPGVRVAAAPVPPVPPRGGGDRNVSGCTLTAAHVLDLIRRMPQPELDKLRQAASRQGGGGFLSTLLTEKGGKRGAHQ